MRSLRSSENPEASCFAHTRRPSVTIMEEMRPLPPDLKEEAHLMELESMGYTIVSVRSHCLLRWRASVAAR